MQTGLTAESNPGGRRRNAPPSMIIGSGRKAESRIQFSKLIHKSFILLVQLGQISLAETGKSGSTRTGWNRSKDESAQILIRHDVLQTLRHIFRGYLYLAIFQLWSGETQFLQQMLQDCIQPPRSDILGSLVHPER